MAQDTPRVLYVALLAATVFLVGIAVGNSARADGVIECINCGGGTANAYRDKLAADAALEAAGLRHVVYGSGVSVIPDPAKAPGVVASTDQAEVCGRNAAGLTYSQAHRQTTAGMKAEVRKRDGVAHPGEIDHRLPLALGGADDVRNLWAQPGPPEPWHFHLKDAMEVLVWDSVCHKRTMTLEQGQAIFLEPDWRRPYCRLIGGPPCDSLSKPSPQP